MRFRHPRRLLTFGNLEPDLSTDAGDLSRLGGLRDQDNTVTVGVFSGEESIAGPSGMDIIGRLMLLAGGFAPEITIPAGERSEYRRYYGVGSSASVLTDAWMATRGDEGETIEGVVTSADGPVSGARVHIFLDEAPWTIAVSDANGAFAATVPEGRAVSVSDICGNRVPY